MKTHYKIHRSICFIIGVSTFSYAETDNFNMSLNGNFQKDYCSIQVDNSIMNIVNTTNEMVPTFINPIDNGKEYMHGGVTIATITCSEQITPILTTSNPGVLQDVENNISYSIGLGHGFGGIDFIGSEPKTLSTLDYYSYDNTYSKEFPLSLMVAPIDGNFQSLPDTYEYTTTVTFILEPTN